MRPVDVLILIIVVAGMFFLIGVRNRYPMMYIVFVTHEHKNGSFHNIRVWRDREDATRHLELEGYSEVDDEWVNGDWHATMFRTQMRV